MNPAARGVPRRLRGNGSSAGRPRKVIAHGSREQQSEAEHVIGGVPWYVRLLAQPWASESPSGDRGKDHTGWETEIGGSREGATMVVRVAAATALMHKVWLKIRGIGGLVMRLVVVIRFMPWKTVGIPRREIPDRATHN